jgi:hypothetical protein
MSSGWGRFFLLALMTSPLQQPDNWRGRITLTIINILYRRVATFSQCSAFETGLNPLSLLGILKMLKKTVAMSYQLYGRPGCAQSVA